jgi:hypothetical protein
MEAMMQYPMTKLRRQAGVAMPIMLIMLGVMLVSSIYLLRSSTSTTLTTTNLAYDSALSRQADFGIFSGYEWLRGQPSGSVVLWDNSPANAYVATMNAGAGQGVSNPTFWVGSRKVTDVKTGFVIEYVIHRLCAFRGSYDSSDPKNNCATSAAKQTVTAKTPVGTSLGSDSPKYLGSPQLHYVITSRISGPRGGTVMNQAVVMMGP